MRDQELFGRDPELAELHRFLQRFAEGSHALQIEGPPGLGKTALWLEGVASARRRSCLVLTARPVEIETKLSFAGLADLLEPVLDDVLPELPGPQRSAFEAALLLAPARGLPDPRGVAAAFLGALRVLARERVVLVAIDDLQWLDSSSHQVAAFAARRLGPEPVGFLLTRRKTEADRPALELEGVLPPERLTRLALRPLDLTAIGRLIEAHLGRPLARPLLRRVYEASGGNPFFALEHARSLQEEGLQFGGGRDLPVPPPLRSLVQDRLARIPAAERDVLLAVSALAAPTRELLVAFAGTIDNGWPPLNDAFESRIVEMVEGQVRFSHPLLGSVLYADTPLPGRQALHGRLAGLVHDPEESARHLALSVGAPSEEVAARLEAAARVAAARGAPSSSGELFELAIDCTPSEDRSASSRRHLDAARQWGAAGDMARSLALLQRAVAVVPPGSERAEALIHLGRATYHSGGCRAAAAIFAEALDEPCDDTPVRVELQMELTWSRHWLGDVEAAEGHARNALALAEELGDSSVLAEALGNLGLIELLRRREGYRATFDRALALEREDTGSPLGYWWMTGWQNTMALAWTGDLEAARASLELLRQHAAERGDEQATPFLVTWLSRVAFWEDEWELAAEFAEESREASVSAPGERAYALASRAVLAAHRGEVELAREAIAEGLGLAEQTGMLSARVENEVALGGLELSLGDVDGAYRSLAPLPALLERHGFAEPAIFRFHPDLVETLVARGELAEAAERLVELEAIAERFPCSWAVGAACRCGGLLAAETGRFDEAFAHFEAALARHDEAGERFERARTLLLYGVALRRAKQRRAARDALSEAELVFETFGATIWAARARGELRRISGAAPRSEALTETEQRIAELATSGRSNKQIAAELHVTVRTVESNLTRVYRKLGVSSRGQLAQLVRP
jgi:DNA-binding CsgD family transcriptional regulator